LRSALERGPSLANIEENRYALETEFGELERSGVDLSASPEVIARQYLNNYQARYGFRAIAGITALRGDEAEDVLAIARDNTDLRDDVRLAAGEALQQLTEDEPPGPSTSGLWFGAVALAVFLTGAGWVLGARRERLRRSE